MFSGCSDNLWLGIAGNDSKVEVRIGVGYKPKNTVWIHKKTNILPPPMIYKYDDKLR